MLVMAIHGFRFSFAPFFSTAVSLTSADISADSTRWNQAHQASRPKMEYFHYVLQNITHSVFATRTNSRNVDLAVVNFSIEISSQPSHRLNRCLVVRSLLPSECFLYCLRNISLSQQQESSLLFPSSSSPMLRCCTTREKTNL